RIGANRSKILVGLFGPNSSHNDSLRYRAAILSNLLPETHQRRKIVIFNKSNGPRSFPILFLLFTLAGSAAAQWTPSTVAARNNLYCAGFVQTAPINTDRRIIGAYNEQDGFIYAQSDVIYLNVGANRGVQVGDRMSVVRPRGKVNTRWTDKGSLGYYVQEVGAVEVIRVKGDHSIATIRTS